MAPPSSCARPFVKCDYCAATFATAANVARHVQTSHPSESRLVGATTPAARLVFGTVGMHESAPPPLLDSDPAPVPLATTLVPLFTVSVDADAAAADAVAATAADNAPGDDLFPAISPDRVFGRPALVPYSEEDDEPPPQFYESDDEGGIPPLIDDEVDTGAHEHVSHAVGGEVDDVFSPLGHDVAGNHGRVPVGEEHEHDGDVMLSIVRLALDTDDETGDGADGEYSSGTDEAAEYCAFDEVDNYLNPVLGAVAAGGGGMTRHVFVSSTAARIRAYYERLPEASRSVPVVDPVWATRPSRFNSPALRGALLFALTAGGSGLSEPDQVSYARSLRAIEREAVRGAATGGPFTSAFGSSHRFLTGTRREVKRVLAERNWQQVPIEVGERVFQYYYHDILQAGLDELAAATTVSFGPNDAAARAADDDGGAHLHAIDLDGDDEGRVRRNALDSNIYLLNERDVKRQHGPDARVMGIHLHADEALVSWSGANYIFPIRAKFINVSDGGGQWVTVGYMEHVPKPVEKTSAARVAASDTRNDLFQRCLALSLRRLIRASETGITAPVAGHGAVRLVPRVVGLVVDQVEERNVLALMGNRCNFFCSHCMEDKRISGALMGIRAVDRDVTTTLDAQLAAAVVRAEDPRGSRRRALGQQHSALAFVPALGAVHGLSTGCRDLYRIVSFDLLHVWKLGFLRLLAQRLPHVLAALCEGRSGARLGSVAATLDAINLRGFHLGRNCKATPAPPGCFVPMKDAQATMTGRSWRHFSSYWPFIVAGALGPADAAASSESGMDGDDVAPVSSTLALVAPLSHAGSDDDGSEFSHDPDAGDVPNQSRGIGSSLPGPNVVTTDRYRDVFGDMPLHDAILELFCRTAQLGGDFFGDNVADTAVMPEELIKRMDARAKALGVDCLQMLYGHTNTSKVHRIIHHMDEELRGRGNLWEGDTSENEKLHGSCKRMFRRSNKRGPTVALQMMRCDEAQSAVLREVVEADAGCSPRASTSASPTNDDEATITAPPTLTEQLSFAGRGEREFVGNLRLSPALA